MRETPVQKQASLAPTVVEEIGKTGVVPTIKKRGPARTVRPPEEARAQGGPLGEDGRGAGHLLPHRGAGHHDVFQQEVDKLVDKRVITKARSMINDGSRVITRIEICDHETVILR